MLFLVLIKMNNMLVQRNCNFSPDHHELYIAAYKMFLDKPILGHGHDMYYKNCGILKDQ